ncbi:MAG TPA: BrnA antitoxin family protein [Pyrinomonadaceae bacterium]|mgnify:FL=1|nr:BrnA antitoxin family protein [Pyrinomonadaceae bacterium]
MKDDFDESILENEEEFKKRFRRISRPAFIDEVVKANKGRITIMLDPDVIEHFKTQAQRSHVGYQTLINQTLRESIKSTAPSDPIENLLKDKKTLKRLKAKLESV